MTEDELDWTLSGFPLSGCSHNFAVAPISMSNNIMVFGDTAHESSWHNIKWVKKDIVIQVSNGLAATPENRDRRLLYIWESGSVAQAYASDLPDELRYELLFRDCFKKSGGG